MTKQTNFYKTYHLPA